jgi:hypothetical protein
MSRGPDVQLPTRRSHTAVGRNEFFEDGHVIITSGRVGQQHAARLAPMTVCGHGAKSPQRTGPQRIESCRVIRHLVPG